MEAAVEALSLDDGWYTALNDEYRRRRVIAGQILDELGCHYDPRQQGLFLWARVPDRYKDGEALADRLLYQARVFITPGSVFGSQGARYVRLSLCATREALTEALARIKQLQS